MAIELKPGDVIVSQEELNQLFQERDQALDNLKFEKAECQKQKVLIQQAILVVDQIDKVVPGLFAGKGLQGLDIGALMMGNKLDAMGPDCVKLKDCIDEYKKNKPVLMP